MSNLLRFKDKRTPAATLETEEDPWRGYTPQQSAVAHFAYTHYRKSSGRYVVKLPRKVPTPVLGESIETASEKGILESLLHCCPDLYHAERVPQDALSKPAKEVFYLPMHCVRSRQPRPNFESCLTLTALPRPQRVTPLNTRSIIIPIAVHSPDSVQATQDSDISFWTSLTEVCTGLVMPDRILVTPFLASQVLRQVASDQFPLASSLVKSSFYEDDFLSGANTVDVAKAMREQLTTCWLKLGYS